MNENRMIMLYKKVLPALGGYICDDGETSLPRVAVPCSASLWWKPPSSAGERAWTSSSSSGRSSSSSSSS